MFECGQIRENGKLCLPGKFCHHLSPVISMNDLFAPRWSRKHYLLSIILTLKVEEDCSPNIVDNIDHQNNEEEIPLEAKNSIETDVGSHFSIIKFQMLQSSVMKCKFLSAIRNEIG